MMWRLNERLSVVVLYRIQAAGLTKKVVTAIAQMVGSEAASVKEAVSRAAGHLALAEIRAHLPSGSALSLLVPTFVALLGPDQLSDVQRQQLHVSEACKVLSLCPHIAGAILVQNTKLVKLVRSICSRKQHKSA